MQDLVQEIGAVAGVAAGVGLVLLAALHRSQARDIRRLSRRAGRAPERSWRVGPGFAAVTVAGLLVLGGAVVSGDETSPDVAEPDKPKPRPAVKRGTVTVAVLNGTTVPGLAAALRDRLAAAGYKAGAINNFPDQQRAESVVQYAPGRRAEAAAVGRSIGIRRREPVTRTSRALVGAAAVIVVAGADQAP